MAISGIRGMETRASLYIAQNAGAQAAKRSDGVDFGEHTRAQKVNAAASVNKVSASHKAKQKPAADRAREKRQQVEQQENMKELRRFEGKGLYVDLYI